MSAEPVSLLTEGERLKLDALATLEARRELYILRGRRALLRRLLDAAEATADDVRAAVKLPDGIDPKCFGSVPGQLARAGIIERVGFTTTGRPEAHARPVSVWRLRDRDAAEAWLRDHPDRADPLPETEQNEAALFDMENETASDATPAASEI